ncbi:MAG: putative protein family [Candidatus Sulfotelmatobacter sp.]|nr:putative protein family [Candidatus Sulfotelmatobacter sp.]
MFMSRAIGFVNSPYKNVAEIPKGLGAKHEADGVLAILPEFEPGLADMKASHILSSSGNSISLAGLSCWVCRLPTTGRMECLRRDRRGVQIRLV